jgi:hypothetical protein
MANYVKTLTVRDIPVACYVRKVRGVRQYIWRPGKPDFPVLTSTSRLDEEQIEDKWRELGAPLQDG